MNMPSISVEAFAADREGIVLLDVREAHELEVCMIEGAVHIPLGQLPARIGELPTDRPIVVNCHHGRRSAQAVQYLASYGFADVRNLEGGIDAWAVRVDPEMARY